MTDFRSDLFIREIAYTSQAPIRVAAVTREVLMMRASPILVGGIVREVLMTTGGSSASTNAFVDVVVREILLADAAPVFSGQPTLCVIA
jgi:hypothetical protein